MMLQNYSFDLDLAWMFFQDLQFAVTVHTFENGYTPHSGFMEIQNENGILTPRHCQTICVHGNSGGDVG